MTAVTDSINNGPTNVVDNGNTNYKTSDDGSNSKTQLQREKQEPE